MTIAVFEHTAADDREPPMQTTALAMWGAAPSAAAAYIAEHHVDRDGFCLGCMNDYGIAVLSPCSQSIWAHKFLSSGA